MNTTMYNYMSGASRWCNQNDVMLSLFLRFLSFSVAFFYYHYLVASSLGRNLWSKEIEKKTWVDGKRKRVFHNWTGTEMTKLCVLRKKCGRIVGSCVIIDRLVTATAFAPNPYWKFLFGDSANRIHIQVQMNCTEMRTVFVEFSFFFFHVFVRFYV